MTNKGAKWVKRVSDDFKKTEELNASTVGAIVVGNRVAVINLSNGTIGVAACSPDDEFDLDTGLAIAWARLNNYTIPDYVINGTEDVCISELKVGQHFIYADWLGGSHEYVKVSDVYKRNRSEICNVYNIATDRVLQFYTVNSGGEKVTPID